MTWTMLYSTMNTCGKFRICIKIQAKHLEHIKFSFHPLFLRNHSTVAHSRTACMQGFVFADSLHCQNTSIFTCSYGRSLLEIYSLKKSVLLSKKKTSQWTKNVYHGQADVIADTFNSHSKHLASFITLHVHVVDAPCWGINTSHCKIPMNLSL